MCKGWGMTTMSSQARQWCPDAPSQSHCTYNHDFHHTYHLCFYRHLHANHLCIGHHDIHQLLHGDTHHYHSIAFGISSGVKAHWPMTIYLINRVSQWLLRNQIPKICWYTICINQERRGNHRMWRRGGMEREEFTCEGSWLGSKL